MHDESRGTIRTAEKEHLQREIELEMALGFDGFLEMDQSLATVTLEDMESSGGFSHEYYLTAIRTARAAKALAESTAAVDMVPD